MIFFFLDPDPQLYGIQTDISDYIDLIDEMIQSFKVPNKLARLSRSIHFRKYWKATEWQYWLLHYSIPALSIVPNFNNYRQHWSLLVEGYFLLLQDTISKEELHRADYLLKSFVAHTEYYYGEDAMSFNIHQLTHLAQSVADWGPLWAHSGYPMETGNGKILKMIHAAKGVQSQICRNLSFQRCRVYLKDHIINLKDFSTVLDYCFYLNNRCVKQTVKLTEIRYFGKQLEPNSIIIQRLNLLLDQTKSFEKIVKSNCVFKSCQKRCNRSNDSYAQLKNGQFIKIRQFLFDMNNTKDYTVYHKIDVENMPCGELTGLKRVVNVQRDVSVTETQNVLKICVFMTANNCSYISTLPNMHCL